MRNLEWRLNVEMISKACGGMFWNLTGDEIVKDIATDSRNISKGAIFFALKGDNFDGHNFVETAIEAGALCAVVQGDVKRFSNLPIIAVDDCLSALGAAAKLYREQFNSPVIAITGSVGKTSTKDMIASVFSSTYNTLKTQGNFNNEIGLPLTVFQITSDHQIIILEMGMSALGEIHRLSNIAKPDMAVITNIGVSHIEKLGSQKNILKAKLEIQSGLSADGAIVLNGDDNMLYDLNGRLSYETLYYGIQNKNCDIVAANIKKSGSGSEFTVSYGGEEYKIRINSAGEHHIYNALAAILVGIRYNIPIAKIIQGISEFSPAGMRQKIVKSDNYTLIEDCYNASPTSMKSGLEVLFRIYSDHDDKWSECRTVAVLGDMLELGKFSQNEHKAVGALVYDFGINVLITVGNEAEYIAAGAIAAGFDPDMVYSFKNNKELTGNIMSILQKGDYVLFKGSRGMKLEEVSKFVAENN